MSSRDPATRLNEALEGRYRIERQLGEGGMATVYLADDLRHDRKVALKVLKPELAAVVGAERFLAEIKTTAKLQHPHILPLFDSGEADGFLFYVMPYVEGESLRERLEREGQLPVEEAVRIASDVAEALDYAHSHGVIHRDIKPANILLHLGRPLVADFGIALAVKAGGAERLTETGLSIGTPHYMSPEQAAGDVNVGAATDVYALGCVLYEMLVGEPPYTGRTPQAILGKVLSSEPASAREQRARVPVNVDAAIRKSLERLPADRFRGVRDFAAALSDAGFRHGPALEASAGSATATGWRLAALAFAALAVVFAAGAGWLALRPAPPALVVRSTVTLPEGLALQTIPGAAFALSPDGSQIVFAGTSRGATQLWRRRLRELSATPVPGTPGARTPAYSPDGTAVAFISAGRLMVVSLTGAPPLTLVERGLAGGASGLAWSDDGWLYFRRADEDGLRRRRADGGGTEEVVTSGPGQDLDPEAVPGGRGLLFTRTNSGGKSEIFLRDMKRGAARRLFDGRTARYAAGHILYTSADGVLMAAPFDARRLEVTGSPSTLFGGIETAPVAGSQFAVSRTGTLLYKEGTAAGGLALAEVDLKGNRHLLPLAPRNFTGPGPTWAPDGESVVFSSDDQIYTYDTRHNTAPRQITFKGQNVNPVFSPDGRRVAFSSNSGDTRGFDVFMKDLSDDSPPRRVLARDGDQIVTQWPADTLLLFDEAEAGGTEGLWMLDISDAGRPRARRYLSLGAGSGSLAVSPDGALAAYHSRDSSSEEIYVRAFPDPGEPTIVSHGGGGVPFWAPDGSTLYYGTRIGRWLVAARLQRQPEPRVLSIDTLFAEAGMGQIPMPGATLNPRGDRFIFAVYPDAAGPESSASGPHRLVLVQNLSEELKRLAPNR